MEESRLVPIVGLSLARLVQSGIQESEILDIVELFTADNSNTSIEHIQSIIDQFRKRRSTYQAMPEESKNKEEKEALDSFQQMQRDIFDRSRYYVP
jgi:hypothetical protein